MDNKETTRKDPGVRAEIYESEDKMKNGGTLYTRIYCFQSDKQILRPFHNKPEDVIKKQNRSFALFIRTFIKKLGGVLCWKY